MAHLDARASACGYANYSATHLTYPPKGLFPLPGKSVEADEGCDLWDEIFNATLLVNPAFNIYRIFDTVSIGCRSLVFITQPQCDLQYPILWDVLGFPYVSGTFSL